MMRQREKGGTSLETDLGHNQGLQGMLPQGKALTDQIRVNKGSWLDPTGGHVHSGSREVALRRGANGRNLVEVRRLKMVRVLEEGSSGEEECGVVADEEVSSVVENENLIATVEAIEVELNIKISVTGVVLTIGELFQIRYKNS